MKVALYTRCSSDMQENLDRSIPAQLNALREYVEKREHSIYKEYAEPGESAYGDDENRQKFHEMIADAKSGKFEAVLVHRYNRFYRDQYKSMLYKKILRENKVKVISITEELDPSTIQGFMLERMIEMMDQVQSMQNAWETFKGMRENAMQGFKNGGVVPYGYKRIQIPVDIGRPNPRYKIKWEIDIKRADIVRKIFDLRCKGNSPKKIALILNSELIPSPRGEWWCNSTVRYILQRADVYAGDYIWNMWDMKTPGQKFKDRSEWIIVKDVHPAIIPREIAEKARIPIGSGKGKYFHTPVHKSKFLLTGKNIFKKPFFICTNCGGNMTGYGMRASKKQNRKIYPKYICSNFHQKGTQACNALRYIPKEWIESKVIEEIDKRYNSMESIDRIIEKMKYSKSDKENEIQNTVKDINKEIRKTKLKIDALFEAIYSGVNKDLLVPESNELSEKVKNLEKKKEELLKEKEISDEIDVESIYNFFSDFKNIMAHGTNEQKSNIIKSYINRILFDPTSDEFTLEFFELPKQKITNNFSGGGTPFSFVVIVKNYKKRIKNLIKLINLNHNYLAYFLNNNFIVYIHRMEFRINI